MSTVFLKDNDPKPSVCEEQIIKKTQELEESNRELEAFCHAVSHDLRAPLRRARSYCQGVLENLDNQDAETARDYANRASLSMAHMNQLINDLLRLSKTQSQVLRPSEFDISLMVDDIAEQLNYALEKPVEIKIQPDIWVVADEGLIRIVLENLLGNAWKYSKKADRPFVEFGASNFQGKTVFYVKDNGAGFNMHYAYKLFTPFQRLHSQKEFDGTGIGLATVKRIVRRHFGRIWAESTVGKGATFYFTLD